MSHPPRSISSGDRDHVLRPAGHPRGVGLLVQFATVSRTMAGCGRVSFLSWTDEPAGLGPRTVSSAAIYRQVVGVMLASILLVACTDRDDSGQPNDSSTTTSAGSSTYELDVAHDYEEFWVALLAASDPPNPDDSGLAVHAVGDELKRARTVLANRRQIGETVRGSYEHSTEVLRVSSVEAEVHDCLVARTVVFDTATGTELRRDPSIPQPLRVVVENHNDVWKVALIEQRDAVCEPASP